VNQLILSSYDSTDLSLIQFRCMRALHGKVGSLLRSLLKFIGSSGLVSIHFIRRSSLGPRRDDLANYWAHRPFVRPFILPVDLRDIYPPQAPNLWVDFEINGPKILGPACSFFILIRNALKLSPSSHCF
jgi:hypothetical protein